MTIRDVFEHVLTEINKVGAPTLLLRDFIYLFNKIVQQYSNEAYNKYDINQQATDDIRVLKTDADLELKSNGTKFYCELPADYMHLLTCSVIFNKQESTITDQCKKKDESGVIESPARRLTADIYQNISTNAYFKPTYKRPYYFINNSNNNVSAFPEANKEMIPTNSVMDDLILSLTGKDRIKGGRHSNATPVLMEIKCGDTNKYYPTMVHIDYIKSPMNITLTEAELDGIDTSQVLEFPDYICYELINKVVKLILENSSDARLNTNYSVNQSIGAPSITDSNK